MARPFAGAVGPDGTTLLMHKVYLKAPSGHRAGTMGYLMYAADGRLLRQSLLARSLRHPRDGASVTPHRRGFLVHRSGKLSYDVSLDGGRHLVRRVWRRTGLRAGDVLVTGERGWAYRRSIRSVVRLRRVDGGEIGHVDGQGRHWVLGRPQEGQDVLWSSLDGSAWTRHVAGTYSDDNDCTCVIDRGPFGRGGVISVGGAPLQHVSLDHGQTWTTHDLSGTRPYEDVVDIRYPRTSALPDGRIVTGYQTYALAADATNTTFTPISLNHPAMWASGLSSGLIFRPGKVSADGGTTWIKCSKP